MIFWGAVIWDIPDLAAFSSQDPRNISGLWPLLGTLSLNEVYIETLSHSSMSNIGGEDVYMRWSELWTEI